LIFFTQSDINLIKFYITGTSYFSILLIKILKI